MCKRYLGFGISTQPVTRRPYLENNIGDKLYAGIKIAFRYMDMEMFTN